MKKIIYFLFICTLHFVSVNTYAQSTMSDSQVTDFIIKEKTQGSTDQEIAVKLMRKGVSVAQIKKVKAKLEKQNKNEFSKDKDPFQEAKKGNRLRKNNTEEEEDKKDKSINFRKSLAKEKTSNSDALLTEEERLREVEDNELELAKTIEELYPDTPTMYKVLIEKIKEKQSQKQIFGHNLFNNKELSFEPEMNIATPEDYHLGAGDKVFIDIYGASHKTIETTVSPEGVVNIEDFGPVQVSGMTVARATEHVRRTLGKKYQNSKIRLSVGQTKTITVNIAGEVKTPGTYTVSAFSTVFNALYQAGGINDIGTLRDIKVYRNGRLISTVDIYEYIMHGKLAGNVRLASNDMIIVGPYDCLVNITGKVKRPMYYEMKKDESLGTLLKYAGGFTGDAYEKNIRLVRTAGGLLSVYNLSEFERNTFKVMDGDSVSVDSALNRFENMVEIKGAVFRPGLYNINNKVNTVRELILSADGLKEDAFTTRGVLYRRKEDRTLEVLSVDINSIMEHRIPDISLRNEDLLYVPSKLDLQEGEILTIMGQVMHEGTYAYASNMTLEDLILQAGGLTDAASLVKVDVARRVRNQKATESTGESAKIYSFKLKDGFVIDGTPGFKLMPYDEIFVRKSPGYIEQQHVTIEGEVNFPGIYTLSEKNQRISDLIKQCGGITPEAFIKGARLERKLSDQEKIKQISLTRLLSHSDSIDDRRLVIGDVRYVGINLDKALSMPHGEYDLILKEGDKLIIPQYNNTVSISGDVIYPNTVLYKKGASLKHYIHSAGGFGTFAKRRKVFAINSNGTINKVRSAKDIRPGCEIVVPSRERRERITVPELVGIGSTLSSIAVVIATLVKQ